MLNLLKINPAARIAGAAALFISTLVASAGIALAAGTIYVKAGVGCSASGPGTQAIPYCTIQQGVDAASSGDTVKVLSGTYPDPVNVNKSLNLVGSAATVTAAGPNGMTLNANNIFVKGFTFSGKTDGPALFTSPSFSGYTITKNTFTNNVFGLYLNSSGTIHSTVNHNTFDGNNQSGAAGGNGIYSDQGVKNAQIDHNVFKNQNNAALIFVVSAINNVQMNLQIDHNTFNGPGAMLILVNGQNVSFDHNQGSGFNGASAVFLGGSDSNIQINHNDLRGFVSSVPLDPIPKKGYSGVRIDLDQANYGTPSGVTLVANTNVSVDHNTVKNFGDGGVSIGNIATPALSTLTSSTINHNSILNNGDSDLLYDAGIFIRAGNTGLNINHNTIRHNLMFDAQDDSLGSGTAGTGNTWDHNSCGTSQPVGLCS